MANEKKISWRPPTPHADGVDPKTGLMPWVETKGSGKAAAVAKAMAMRLQKGKGKGMEGLQAINDQLRTQPTWNYTGEKPAAATPKKKTNKRKEAPDLTAEAYEEKNQRKAQQAKDRNTHMSDGTHDGEDTPEDATGAGEERTAEDGEDTAEAKEEMQKMDKKDRKDKKKHKDGDNAPAAKEETEVQEETTKTKKQKKQTAEAEETTEERKKDKKAKKKQKDEEGTPEANEETEVPEKTAKAKKQKKTTEPEEAVEETAEERKKDRKDKKKHKDEEGTPEANEETEVPEQTTKAKKQKKTAEVEEMEEERKKDRKDKKKHKDEEGAPEANEETEVPEETTKAKKHKKKADTEEGEGFTAEAAEETDDNDKKKNKRQKTAEGGDGGEQLASLGRMPLTAVEMRRYVDAVKAHKKDVKEWEQRMTSKEIVNARCNAEAWPVPSDLNLEAWLDQLVEEQRPLRCVNAEVQVKSIRMEVLQATETPGRLLGEHLEAYPTNPPGLPCTWGVESLQVDPSSRVRPHPSTAARTGGTGCNLHLEDLTLGAATLDPSEQISRDPTDAFLLKAADEGKRKMEARLQLGTMQMDCEAPGSQAASEIKIAADQLLHIISKGKELVSFEELQEFFSRDRGERAHKGQVVLCLNELTKPDCLGVSLEPRFQQWVLRGETPAIDMWSDPAMSTRMLSWSKEDPETTVHLDIAMDGLSVRLADTQHASSVPRAKLDLKDVYLKGGIRRGSSGIAALESGLKGSLQLSAEYWNQSLGITEPFVEPWRLQLSASPHLLCLRAEEHLVLNLTPPLIQALSVASNSLADAKDEGVELRHTETPVAVWVYNRTLCDVRVAVRNPEGERSLAKVKCSRLHLPLGLPRASGFRARHQECSVECGHQQSGIGLLENMTSSNLTVCLGKDSEGKEQTLELEPYQLWNAGIGGGYEVTLPLDKHGHFKAKLPTDSDPLDDKEKLLERLAGFRFVLLAHEGRKKNEPRDRVVVCVPMLSVLNALPCDIRHLAFHDTFRRNVPHQFLMLSDAKSDGDRTWSTVVRCCGPRTDRPSADFPEPEPPQSGRHEAVIQEADTAEAHTQADRHLRHPADEVDPDLQVEVVVRMAGFTYRAFVPAKCLKSKNAVMRACSDNAHLHFDLSARSLCLIAEDSAAPPLAMDLERRGGLGR
eukprot:g1727.t1